MTFGIVCIIVGVVGVAGGIWLAMDKRTASVIGGVVIALLSFVPVLFGTLLLAYVTTS